MHRIMAAVLAASSCAVAQAQDGTAQTGQAAGPLLTLDEAVALAAGEAPAGEAAQAAVRAAQAGRVAAGLRPNPSIETQVENVAGSGPYRGFDAAEATVALSIPIELGGKRSARIAVADAQVGRAGLQAAIARADLRFQVTQLYVEAAAAERRLATAYDQLRIAREAAEAAAVRVRAGRASPLEEQRADVARLNAQAAMQRAERLADAAAANLARRVGQPVAGRLDPAVLDDIPATAYGPAAAAAGAEGTLALAAAAADLALADAGVRLARSQRMPDLAVGPGVRRLAATGDTALVFSVSLPLPVFDTGRAAVAQAEAERGRAEAQRRATALDVEQAITDARAEAENAATTARMANGPALAAAQEAARIARIGYREGKFGQLDLLDTERTLAETRAAAIDALAAYRNAKARLERLTTPAPAPDQGN